MAKDILKDLGIEFSQEIYPGGVKLMFWGDTATRKTETVVRNFPHVLLIDTEGNSDVLIGHPEIPPFLRVKSKDVRQILNVLEAAAQGKLKFPDGSLVETVSLDSWTVLWGVQSDVASKMAEKRAEKKNYNIDEANITMTDWAKSKRPMKRILNIINGSQIKFLILIARQKDEYETSAGNMDAKKTGRVIPDVMKGTEYEVNLALHFFIENGKWDFETSKVQGSLIDLFPLGKKQAKFPFEEFFARFSGLDPSKSTKMRDEDEVTGEIADAETPHSREELIEFGKGLGLSPMDIGTALKIAGMAFDPKRWDEMVHVLENTAKLT